MMYTWSYISAAGWLKRYIHESESSDGGLLCNDIVDTHVYTFSSMRVIL